MNRVFGANILEAVLIMGHLAATLEDIGLRHSERVIPYWQCNHSEKVRYLAGQISLLGRCDQEKIIPRRHALICLTLSFDTSNVQKRASGIIAELCRLRKKYFVLIINTRREAWGILVRYFEIMGRITKWIRSSRYGFRAS